MAQTCDAQIIRWGALGIGVLLFSGTLYYINFRLAVGTIRQLGIALPLALLFSGLWHLARTWAWSWCFPQPRTVSFAAARARASRRRGFQLSDAARHCRRAAEGRPARRPRRSAGSHRGCRARAPRLHGRHDGDRRHRIGAGAGRPSADARLVPRIQGIRDRGRRGRVDDRGRRIAAAAPTSSRCCDVSTRCSARDRRRGGFRGSSRPSSARCSSLCAAIRCGWPCCSSRRSAPTSAWRSRRG